MKIEFLISTFEHRILQVSDVLLPTMGDVSYVICHQVSSHGRWSVPDGLQRSDVKVIELVGKGVAFSRNRALDLAEGDVSIFGDDDVRYCPEYVAAVKSVMASNPGVDVAKFRIATLDGEPAYADWPEREYQLVKAESTGTVQLAVRVKSIRGKGIRFDTRFGAGNERLIGGDEQVFMHDCLQAGLRVRYFPFYIVQHSYWSSAKRIPPYDCRKNRVTGGLDARLNGWVAIPKAFLGSIRYYRDIRSHGRSPLRYFWDRLTGALYILTTGSPTSNRSSKGP